MEVEGDLRRVAIDVSAAGEQAQCRVARPRGASPCSQKSHARQKRATGFDRIVAADVQIYRRVRAAPITTSRHAALRQFCDGAGAVATTLSDGGVEPGSSFTCVPRPTSAHDTCRPTEVRMSRLSAIVLVAISFAACLASQTWLVGGTDMLRSKPGIHLNSQRLPLKYDTRRH